MLGVAFLTVTQFLLGALTLVLHVPVVMATMHQLTACLLIGGVTGWVQTLWATGSMQSVIEPLAPSDDPVNRHHGTLGAGHPAEGTV